MTISGPSDEWKMASHTVITRSACLPVGLPQPMLPPSEADAHHRKLVSTRTPAPSGALKKSPTSLAMRSRAISRSVPRWQRGPQAGLAHVQETALARVAPGRLGVRRNVAAGVSQLGAAFFAEVELDVAAR